MRKEAFSFEDEDVVLIDPGIQFKSIFKGIDLPCNKEQRINNSLNAPTRKHVQSQFQNNTKKQYDSDSDGNSFNKEDSKEVIPASKCTLHHVN